MTGPAGRFLLRDVEVRGSRVDVALQDGRVTALAPQVPELPGDRVLEGAGGALLPALHDHHVHLFATATLERSVDVSTGWQALAARAADTAPGRWIRAVGADASVDRHHLDALVADRPVRVQHRSGALWMLNSPALAAVAHVLDDTEDVERDHTGAPTGRLWRYDQRLRPALGDRRQELLEDLTRLDDRLAALGIGSVTDATPDLDPDGVQLLRERPFPVTMLGDPDGPAPWKIHLSDHDLPSWADLVERIRAARARNRAVAVHCVTREALFLTLAALDEVGRHPDDRIEHASVVVDPASLRGLTVITHPGFLAVRGDDYLRDVHPDDLPGLYRWRSLSRSGVRVLPGSDAPHGPLDPWQVIAAARDRRSPRGVVLADSERITTRAALAGYLTDDRGRPRHVRIGAPARLALLHTRLDDALRAPHADLVRWCSTQVTSTGWE